ncbi:MAG: hypothetical protein QJR01_01670 [Kyrpidia sp.]|nr:hypothetical protein [Kyrpidia sp.]
MKSGDWASVELPPGASLLRKETFTFQIGGNEYGIELFETAGGEFYAVGMPQFSDKIVVYGSPVVPSPVSALQIVIDKIRRERVEG